MCCNYRSLRTLEPVLCNKRNHHMGSPCTTTRELPLLAATKRKPTCSNKDPPQPKNNKKFRKEKGISFQILGYIFITEFCIALWRPLCCCLFLANCHMLIDMSHVDSPCPLTDIPKLHGKCGFNSAPSSYRRIWKPTSTLSSIVHSLALPSLISHVSNCYHPIFYNHQHLLITL